MTWYTILIHFVFRAIWGIPPKQETLPFPGLQLEGAVTQLVPAATLAALVTAASLGGFKGDEFWLTGRLFGLKQKHAAKCIKYQVGVMDLFNSFHSLIDFEHFFFQFGVVALEMSWKRCLSSYCSSFFFRFWALAPTIWKVKKAKSS